MSLLPGARIWMVDQIAAGTEMDMLQCLRVQPADLSTRSRLQLCFAVEFLAARDGLATVLERYRAARREGLVDTAALVATLDQPVEDFTAEWRAWMAGGGEEASVRGLLLQDPTATVDDGDIEGWLTAINDLRLSADREDLRELPQLSAACRAWAQDLAAGRAEPSTPEALWARDHSIYTADHDKIEKQLAAWMATVHMREAILARTCRGVGIATVDDALVIDFASMDTLAGLWHAHWPPHESRELPSRHAPVGPDPVPGVDTAELGYPVTFTLSSAHGQPLVELSMTGPDGVVDCWYTSPLAPLNPDHVPRGVYALIPKEPLTSGRQYDVTASWGEYEVQWSFITD